MSFVYRWEMDIYGVRWKMADIAVTLASLDRSMAKDP